MNRQKIVIINGKPTLVNPSSDSSKIRHAQNQNKETTVVDYSQRKISSYDFLRPSKK
jgi:hemin uptake protein HemP